MQLHDSDERPMCSVSEHIEVLENREVSHPILRRLALIALISSHRAVHDAKKDRTDLKDAVDCPRSILIGFRQHSAGHEGVQAWVL
jgi:hypothetical protein